MNTENLDFMWDTESPEPIEESQQNNNADGFSKRKTTDNNDKPVSKPQEDDTNSDEEDVEADIEEEEEEKTSKKKATKADKEASKDDEDEEEETLGADGSVYNDFFNDLKEHGIFKNVDIEDGEELTPEKLFELHQAEYEAEVDNRLEAFGNRLGDDGKHFIEFIKRGGRTQDYLDQIQSFSVDLEGDLDDEDYQDHIIAHKMQQDGRDQDEIEERLEYLHEKGKKKQVAEKALQAVKQAVKQRKDDMLAKAQAHQQQLINSKREYIQGLREAIEDVDTINGIKIHDKQKEHLIDFLTKDAYVAKDGSHVTAFQKKLHEVFQDPHKSILMAKMLSSDFDFSDYAKSIESKTTKKIKSNLENRIGLSKKKTADNKNISFDW